MIKASYKKHVIIFKQPAGTSRGILTKKDVFFLKLVDTENASKTGIGEIAPIPGLSPDAVPDLEKKIQNLVRKINDGEKILENEFSGFPALSFAYETALNGINSSSPVLLFPSEFTSNKKGIPINGLIWMGTKESMLTQVEEKIAAGFTCLKLKIGAIDFDVELDILRSIRKRFSVNELEIRVDANGAFSPKNALKKLEQLAAFHLHSIEQPIKQGQFEAMQKLCNQTPFPIALDEELIGVEKYAEKEKLLDYIQPQYIILKPTLLGGFKASEEWIDLAKQRKIGWWVTSALESNIGLNAIAQWTATLGTSNFQGLGTGALYTNNIESPLYISNGNLFYAADKNWNLESI